MENIILSFLDGLIFTYLCLGSLNIKRREALDVISGDTIRGNGDEKEKLG